MTQPKLDLMGKFSPFLPSGQIGVPDQPVYISLNSHPGQFWCAIFSNENDLHKIMKAVNIKDYKVKYILDGKEFAASILSHKVARIMLDPKQENGKVKWQEIVVDEL